MIVNKYKINLKGQTGCVKEFTQLTENIPQLIDIESGRYCVNAKSLLGIISLDTSKDLTMVVYGDCYSPSLKKILDLFEVR